MNDIDKEINEIITEIILNELNSDILNEEDNNDPEEVKEKQS
jgi:hypothetical protein